MRKEKKGIRVALPFLIIIILIFLIAISLSWKNISRIFRLGLLPVGIEAVQEEFTYTIASSQLQPGEVVAYYSFANDTSGNWNMTNMTQSIRTFTVIYPENVTNIEILNKDYNPATQIPQGQDFHVRITIDNYRSSSVNNPLVTYQIKNPDGTVTQRVASSSPSSHSPGVPVTFTQGFGTASSPKGKYTAEGRVITNWARLGGFIIAYTRNTTFDIV